MSQFSTDLRWAAGEKSAQTPAPDTKTEGQPPSSDIGCASVDVKRRRPPGVPSERQRALLDSAILILVLAVVCLMSMRPSAASDEDLWWHVRTGDWILGHRTVPTHDLFGFYTAGKPWIAYTWSFDLLASRVYSAWGLHGTLMMTTLAMLVFMSLTVVLLSRYCTLLRAIELTALVFASTIRLAEPRPWLFTCIFFVLELCLLVEARERGKTRWLLPLPLLLALWANMHVQFIYGLGLILLFALERPLAAILNWHHVGKLRAQPFWFVLTISALSTLLNPYGWRLYTVVWTYATQSSALRLVQEMQAPNFRNLGDWASLLLVCSAIFAIGNSPKKSPLLFSLLVPAIWFGFHAQRDVWFLAIAAALALAASLGMPAERSLAASRYNLSGVLSKSVVLPVTLLVAFVRLHSTDLSGPQLEKDLKKRFPVEASAYIEKHGLQGPLFNTYDWGGYLIWRLPNLPVSIDGRANLYGDAQLARFATTWSGSQDWASDPELMKANTIVLGRNSALASILRSDRRFHLAYQDELASVFQPVRTYEQPRTR